MTKGSFDEVYNVSLRKTGLPHPVPVLRVVLLYVPVVLQLHEDPLIDSVFMFLFVLQSQRSPTLLWSQGRREDLQPEWEELSPLSVLLRVCYDHRKIKDVDTPFPLFGVRGSTWSVSPNIQM